MSKLRLLTAGMLAACLVGALSQSAAAVIYVPELGSDASEEAGIQLVDARGYNHCHNMPRRTRCHGKARLPVNWPPNTNTPGTSSVRERQADKSNPCDGSYLSGPCRR